MMQLLIKILGLKQLIQEDNYIYKMEEALFIVSYKTTGELFDKRFVYNSYVYNDRQGEPLNHEFYNDITGEELHVYVKHLESLSTKPYFIDDTTNDTKNS